jgi:hypothetical protein
VRVWVVNSPFKGDRDLAANGRGWTRIRSGRRRELIGSVSLLGFDPNICVHPRPFAAKLFFFFLPEIRESLDDTGGFYADPDYLADQADYVAGIVFAVWVGFALHLILIDYPVRSGPRASGVRRRLSGPGRSRK